MQFNVSFITMFPAAVYLFPIIYSPLHLLDVDVQDTGDTG